jgi:ABC-type branched-subunit amino acid transport system substrate-binding protein
MTQGEIWHVGAVADIAMGGSVHTTTFLRAVQLALEHLVPRCHGNLALHLISDNADATGAHRAADSLLRAGVHAVIGHYASVAATAAAPSYAEAGVPLLLPAATADGLVDSFPNTLRLCGADSQLAARICQDLQSHFEVDSILLQDDGGLHGRSLSAAIYTCLMQTTSITIATSLDRAQAVLFCGSFRESVGFVRALRDKACALPVFLTDDAVHPLLSTALQGGDRVYVYGFGPALWQVAAHDICSVYRSRWDAEPGVYFLETYAAFELVAHWVENGISPECWLNAAQDRTWPTVLGPITLAHRQYSDPSYALWSVSQDRLRPLRRLGQPVSIPTPRGDVERV